MDLFIHFQWMHFCIALGAVLVLSYIMSLQSRNFYTDHIVVRKFSILDLEFPASPRELINYIKGIFLLPAELSAKTLRNLRGQLYVDFLFMVAAYGSVFILCMKVAGKMTDFGFWIFMALAWLQIIPLICDVIENIYLLGKLKPEPPLSTQRTHNAYLKLEICKWGIPLTGVVCCIAAIAYFWLTGNYTYNSIEYFVLIIAELALFFILKKATAKNDNEKLDAFRS